MDLFNVGTNGTDFGFPLKDDTLMDLNGLNDDHVVESQLSFDLPPTHYPSNDWHAHSSMQLQAMEQQEHFPAHGGGLTPLKHLPPSSSTTTAAMMMQQATQQPPPPPPPMASLASSHLKMPPVQTLAPRPPVSDDGDSTHSSPLASSPQHSDNAMPSSSPTTGVIMTGTTVGAGVLDAVQQMRMKVAAIPMTTVQQQPENNNNGAGGGGGGGRRKRKNSRSGSPNDDMASFIGTAAYAEALASFELPAFMSKPESEMTEYEKKETKRQQRLLRNRVSAQLSRERKKAYVVNLEGQLDDMRRENEMLRSQMQSLSALNVDLRRQLQMFESNNNHHQHYHNGGSSSNDDGSSNGDHRSPMLMAVEDDFAADCLQQHARKQQQQREQQDLYDGDNNNNTAAAAAAAGYQHQQHKRRRTSGNFNGKTGVVLFALVFSFGVFYHMVQLDPNADRKSAARFLRVPDGVDIDDVNDTRGRILHSVQSRMQMIVAQTDATVMTGSDAGAELPPDMKLLQESHLRTMTNALQAKAKSVGVLPHFTSVPESMPASMKKMESFDLVLQQQQQQQQQLANNNHTSNDESGLPISQVSLEQLFKCAWSWYNGAGISQPYSGEAVLVYSPSPMVTSAVAPGAEDEVVMWVPTTPFAVERA